MNLNGSDNYIISNISFKLYLEFILYIVAT